jgi:hypothetical protein
LRGRDLVWQHRHQGGEQRVEEQLGDAPADEDHRNAGCQRHHEDAERTAHQAVTIQGRRMPSRDVVRSLILPKNGFPTIANRAPVPVATAKLLGACSIPTSEFTFNARVTSRGSPAVEGSCGWALGVLGPGPEPSGIGISQAVWSRHVANPSIATPDSVEHYGGNQDCMSP